MPSEQRVKAGEARRQQQISGDLLRAGVYNARCPQCGAPPQFKKTYCYGIEPDLQRVVMGFQECPWIGPHLHCVCAVCDFGWFERCASDDLMRDGRGGLRFDETVNEDGEIVRKPGLSLASNPRRSSGPSPGDPSRGGGEDTDIEGTPSSPRG